MKNQLTSVLAAALIGLSAGGCTQYGQQRINFDGTPEGLRKSVQTIANQLKPERKAEVQHALDIYLSQQEEPSESRLRTTTPIASLSGVTLGDFLAQARRIEDAEPEFAVTDYPTWINPRLVSVMQLELDALEENREALNSAGFFTLDELPFSQVSFIPPPHSDVRVANNKAIFAFRMWNNTGLTIYRPVFNVRIQMPGEELPAYSGRLTWDDPVGIPDGGSRLVDLSCCSIVREPYLNKRLRQLNEKASISVELVAVEDYRKRNPLRTVGYSSREQVRERNLIACIADINARIEKWTPARSVRPCKQILASTRTGSEQLAEAVQALSSRMR